jgi:hypothetical protein
MFYNIQGMLKALRDEFSLTLVSGLDETTKLIEHNDNLLKTN